MSPCPIEPVVLEGRFVRLEPASEAHAADLARNCGHDLFRYFVTDRPRSSDEAGLTEFIRSIWQIPNTLPFAIVDQNTGQAVGGTCFLDIRAAHRGLEIGMTWIGHALQGTYVNPEAKLLLLRHAFETLGYERVQLKCDARNEHSQAAILKLGAVFEGRLRKHFVLPDGFVRDTMMYSIVREEWPAVRSRLEARLES